MQIRLSETIEFSGMRLDVAGHSLFDGAGREMKLTRGEFAILTALARRPGQVLSRDQLLDAVSGRSADAFDRSIDNLVSRLRRKIEPDQFYKSKVRYSRMLLDHSPDPYAGRIAVIVNQEQAQYDKDLGWSGFPECDLEIYSAPGSHSTMFTEHVKHVAQVILKCIDEAMPGIRRDVPPTGVKFG